MQFTVAEARRYRKKTQKESASALNVCEDTFRKLERNPDEMTIKQARLFCSLVGLSMEQISFAQDSSLTSHLAEDEN